MLTSPEPTSKPSSNLASTAPHHLAGQLERTSASERVPASSVRRVPPAPLLRDFSAKDLEAQCRNTPGTALPRLARPGDVYADGRLVVLECLGSGGVGEVHLVHDRLLDRRAALKLMLPLEDGSPNDAALAEARAMARLNHENVVTLYDAGSHDDCVYLLMEYLDGVPLSACIGSSPPSPTRAIEIAIDMARGLEHAHGRGVLHLDLKPSNVFLLRNGRAKLLDFGVGGLHWAGQFGVQGDSSAVVGTPLYMAPEQWGLGPLDTRTDLWAAGILLYELLSGSSPSPGRAPSFRVHTARTAPVPALNPRLGLPGEVDALLARALSPDPTKRFQTAVEWQTALTELLALVTITSARSADTRRR